MRTIVCTNPGHLDYKKEIKPILTPGNALVKVKRIGICGTDLHAFEGTQPFFSYPRILGHEISGELVELDNAPGFQIGEEVTFIPYFNCKNCIACRAGKPNCCVNIKVFGVHIDGGMMEFISVPSHLLVHGQGLSLDELALVEPLAIGAHGIKRAGVKKDDFVLVVGAGPIGLAAMEFARIAGAKVIAMDVNNNRLGFCREKLKIEHLINPLYSTVEEQLKAITKGDMPQVIVDATGNQKAINQTFQYMAHGGTYVLIGLQKHEISFSHPEFHKREGTLMSSRNATRNDFEHVIDSIRSGLINPSAYITHRVSFEQVKDKFQSWLNPATEIIKVMVSIG